MSTRLTLAGIAAASLALAACAPRAVPSAPAAHAASDHASPPDVTVAASAPPAPAKPAAPDATRAPLPTAIVHKSASCGCCALWVDHLRAAGFPVTVNDVEDLEPVKKRLGVPSGKGSCHTAEIGGLVVEGHVPAGDIKRALQRRDGIRGLVLPGMPAGSPGMEMPDGRVQRYTVETINADGTTSPFSTHGG